MSKDRPFSSTKHQKKGKGKRVVAAPSPPPSATKPMPAKPGGVKAAEALKGTKPTTPPSPRLARPLAQPAPTELAGRPAWSISLELVLYVVLAGIAFAVRLYALGRFPLQESEGISAWAAWGLLRGLPNTALTGQAPLPIFAATLSFLLFGAGDAAARLVPALAGGLCVVLPYALRRELGRAGALVAASILCIGPTFLLVSRSVDGGMIVAAGSLALLACGLAYRRDGDDRYIYLAAIAIGVMFAADKTAGPVIFILGALAIVSWLRSEEVLELPRESLRKAALLFIGTAILLGTGMLSNLQGVQSALIDPLAIWLTASGVGTFAERFAFYGRVLLAYEPFVLLFSVAAVIATVGLAVGTRRSTGLLPRKADSKEDTADGEEAGDEQGPPADFSLTPLLAAWSVLAFAFYVLLGDQSPASVVQILIPMTLLAAELIGRRIESGNLVEGGSDFWLLVALLILIVFAFIAALNPTSLFGGRFTSLERLIQNATNILLALMAMAMLSVAAWLAYQQRFRTVPLAVATALGIVLVVFTVHSSWQLNHVEWANATEPLLMQRTAQDVRTMLDDIVAVSRQQGDDAIEITLDDRLQQPVRWYLRRFTSVTVARVGAQTKTPVVIAPVDTKESMSRSLGRGYVNQRYRLASTWQAEAPLIRWLRWAHVREQVNTPVAEDIIAFYKLPQ